MDTSNFEAGGWRQWLSLVYRRFRHSFVCTLLYYILEINYRLFFSESLVMDPNGHTKQDSNCNTAAQIIQDGIESIKTGMRDFIQEHVEIIDNHSMDQERKAKWANAVIASARHIKTLHTRWIIALTTMAKNPNACALAMLDSFNNLSIDSVGNISAVLKRMDTTMKDLLDQAKHQPSNNRNNGDPVGDAKVSPSAEGIDRQNGAPVDDVHDALSVECVERLERIVRQLQYLERSHSPSTIVLPPDNQHDWSRCGFQLPPESSPVNYYSSSSRPLVHNDRIVRSMTIHEWMQFEPDDAMDLDLGVAGYRDERS
jgi:hypothetical protein